MIRNRKPRVPTVTDEMVDRFLRWPLPESVRADDCATKQQTGRFGTNLLTAIEAKQMLEYVLTAPSGEGGSKK